MKAAEPDEVAVARAVDGDRSIPLTRDEVRLAWQRLEAQQRRPAHEVARILGVSRKSVERWRGGVQPQARHR